MKITENRTFNVEFNNNEINELVALTTILCDKSVINCLLAIVQKNEFDVLQLNEIYDELNEFRCQTEMYLLLPNCFFQFLDEIASYDIS